MPRRAVPFVIIGGACIVVGGLISAATAFSPSQIAAWAVAYLVLVAGVAQVALGLGQGLLASDPPSWRLVCIEIIAVNIGNAAVIAGTLVRMPFVVDAGGALLVLALALLIWGVRGSRDRMRWVLYGYRLLTLIVLVSIPIGLVLSHIRAV